MIVFIICEHLKYEAVNTNTGNYQYYQSKY